MISTTNLYQTIQPASRQRSSLARIARGLFLGALLLTATAPKSWAWARSGHRLTALVAEHYLTPETRAQVVELLQIDPKSKETLAQVASWADDYRTDHPETGKWHYADIPKSEAKFDRDRDCPVSVTDPTSPWRDCITDRILYFEGRLGDTTLSAKERAMALKFVIHFLGDIHQPFHAIGDDRGGNGISVTFLGSKQCGSYNCNLHGVWDDSMIDHSGLSEQKYVAKLLQEIDENHWERLAGGEPTTWVNISHRYAVNASAPNGALLTHEYVEEESKIVDSQIALGGLRLARVLNRILGTPVPPADQPAQPGRSPLPRPAAEPAQPPAVPAAPSAPAVPPQ